jgi:hypothetical protein
MKLTNYFKLIASLFISKLSSICFASIGLLLISCNQTSTSDYAVLKAPVVFTPNIPVDVDPELQEKLKKEGDIYTLNETYNLYSWQAFMAIHWPVSKDGTPKSKFTDEGTPAWIGWKEAFQVYREDGQKPAPWGAPRTDFGLDIPKKILADSDARIVLSSSTPTHPDNFSNIADETDQAFAGKLFDQNGNVVVYEVLMNQIEFDYVVENQLYNINGQLNFSSTGAIADFPAGDYNTGYLGAVEIKLAWKILEGTDIKSRYYKNKGYVYDQNNVLVEKNLGLIGMHISQKTPTGKQWVWSTFEHVDNLDQNVIKVDGKRKVIHPTLRDPDCEICPANYDVSNGTTFKFMEDPKGNYWQLTGQDKQKRDIIYPERYWASEKVPKTQAFRMVDIPVRVKNINNQMQAYFAKEGSIWQYYKLVDTQYPLNQNALPGPHGNSNNRVPESVVNKSGGDPNIALLTNITMETFFQKGNQSASHLIEGNPKNQTTIFGTESCIACHSSAGIYNVVKGEANNNGPQLSGDFSWLLGKAKYNDSIPAPYPIHKNK